MEVNFHSSRLCFKLLLSARRSHNLRRMCRKVHKCREVWRAAVAEVRRAAVLFGLVGSTGVAHVPVAAFHSAAELRVSDYKNLNKLPKSTTTRAPVMLIEKLRMKDVGDENTESCVIFSFTLSQHQKRGEVTEVLLSPASNTAQLPAYPWT